MTPVQLNHSVTKIMTLSWHGIKSLSLFCTDLESRPPTEEADGCLNLCSSGIGHSHVELSTTDNEYGCSLSQKNA